MSGPAHWFAEEWTRLLGNVLEAMAGERPGLTCAPPPTGAALAGSSEEIARTHGSMLWWELRFPLPGEPALCIGTPRKVWAALAGRILGPDGGEDEAQARETYLEVLQQSMGELSRSAGKRWGRPIDGVGKEAAAAPAAGEFFLVQVAYANGALPPVLAVIGGTPTDPPGPTPVSTAEPQTQPPSRTFDLLMDVELPVSVSFGHVQIPLQDVLKLTAGSIIELNRTVDEPVEVIVNNCVIARGEVVVVEGNYGVRIYQIMSRQARLETLP